MMFLIIAMDKPGQLERRLELRPSHRGYWTGLGSRLKLAGPTAADDSVDAAPIGSFFLVEAENEGEAKRLIDADPFTTEGVFEADVRIRQVSPVIGEWIPS